MLPMHCHWSQWFQIVLLLLSPDIPKAFVAWVGTSWHQWRESWKSASVVNAHLVDNPTIRQPGFALRQQWSLLSRFRTRQGHCSACKTLSNPAHRQDYTVACLNYTLQAMMPLPGWPVMAPNAYDNNNNCCCCPPAAELLADLQLLSYIVRLIAPGVHPLPTASIWSAVVFQAMGCNQCFLHWHHCSYQPSCIRALNAI